MRHISDGARHPTRTFSDIAVFGTMPPKPISYNDFCPPANCPNCENRCHNIHHRDIEIRQLNFDGIRFPGITNRTFGMYLFAFNISVEILFSPLSTVVFSFFFFSNDANLHLYVNKHFLYMVQNEALPDFWEERIRMNS